MPEEGLDSGLKLTIWGVLLAFSLGALLVSPAHGQAGNATDPKTRTEARQVAEQGPRFLTLTAGEQAALKPLEKDWSAISAERKQKWRVIAARFPSMSPEERDRIQMRMSEWAQMSPEQRGKVRLQFQEANKSTPQNRQAQWQAYQALPADQKRDLAAKAATVAASSGSQSAQLKSNIVANPALALPQRSITPSVVQAQPGATTNLISKRVTPPVHQQTGQPKIAASPEFVDSVTLLPQKGAQGAMSRSTAASASSPSP